MSIVGFPIVENGHSPSMCRFHPIIRNKVVAKGGQSGVMFGSTVSIRHYTCRSFRPLRQDSRRYVSRQRWLGEVGGYWGCLNGVWSEVGGFANICEVFRRQQFLYWAFEGSERFSNGNTALRTCCCALTAKETVQDPQALAPVCRLLRCRR